MAEYIDRQDLDFLNDFCIDSGKYVGLRLDDVFNELATADVIERSKIDKAIEEIEQTLYVDSLIFGELFDFKDGKISADDVIEEFNKVTRKEVLEIIKRNIGE